MRKTILIPIVLLLLCYSVNAQEKNNILKIIYLATPESQYDTPPPNNPNYQELSSSKALAQSYKHFHSLYINLETQQSIYIFDSIARVNVPKGQEEIMLMINNNVEYVLKNEPNKFLKYETVFQREFYSVGNIQDVEWEITDEEKIINGLNSRKAVPKDKDILMSAWYTTDIPVSGGPADFLGLPGLVVWADNFFWTIEIQDVSYVNDEEFNFEYLLKKYENKFNQNKKSNTIDEKVLILRKVSLIESMLSRWK